MPQQATRGAGTHPMLLRGGQEVGVGPHIQRPVDGLRISGRAYFRKSKWKLQVSFVSQTSEAQRAAEHTVEGATSPPNVWSTHSWAPPRPPDPRQEHQPGGRGPGPLSFQNVTLPGTLSLEPLTPSLSGPSELICASQRLPDFVLWPQWGHSTGSPAWASPMGSEQGARAPHPSLRDQHSDTAPRTSLRTSLRTDCPQRRKQD